MSLMGIPQRRSTFRLSIFKWFKMQKVERYILFQSKDGNAIEPSICSNFIAMKWDRRSASQGQIVRI